METAGWVFVDQKPCSITCTRFFQKTYKNFCLSICALQTWRMALYWVFNVRRDALKSVRPVFFGKLKVR